MNPRVCRGHCNNRPASAVAPRHGRYVGMYYWSTYWQQWDKIVAVNEKGWTVRSVSFVGSKEVLEAERTHCTEMDARCFADKPFEVLSPYGVGAMQ